MTEREFLDTQTDLATASFKRSVGRITDGDGTPGGESDLEAVVRQHPVASLGAGAVLGFVGGSLLGGSRGSTASQSRRTERDDDSFDLTGAAKRFAGTLTRTVVASALVSGSGDSGSAVGD